MHKNTLIIICLALALGVVGYFFFANGSFNQAPTQEAPQGKLDIAVVCESALAYMTFPDGASADAFVAECKEGKHPDVIERYKEQMGLGDGAAI